MSILLLLLLSGIGTLRLCRIPGRSHKIIDIRLIPFTNVELAQVEGTINLLAAFNYVTALQVHLTPLAYLSRIKVPLHTQTCRENSRLSVLFVCYIVMQVARTAYIVFTYRII